MGTLTISQNTSVEDVKDVVDAIWFLGRFEAPDEVRQLLLTRQRWQASRPARRDWTTRVSHHERTVDGVKKDYSVGVVWFDRYELAKRVELAVTTDLTVNGVVVFASDVTAELVERAFHTIRIQGAVIAPRTIREVVNRLKLQHP